MSVTMIAKDEKMKMKKSDSAHYDFCISSPPPLLVSPLFSKNCPPYPFFKIELDPPPPSWTHPISERREGNYASAFKIKIYVLRATYYDSFCLIDFFLWHAWFVFLGCLDNWIEEIFWSSIDMFVTELMEIICSKK